MLLEEATGQASVDLFLRNLRFEFPTRDLVGIPGRLINASECYDEETLALLLHELEHISTLTHPAGPVFTSIAVRAFDLRNEMVAKLQSVSGRFLAEAPWKKPHSKSLNNELADAARTAIRQAEMARTVHVFAELMAPLLEGLAVMAEFENGGDWTWHTVLTMEYLHRIHFLFLHDRDSYLSAIGESREAGIGLLYDALEKQIATAREIRRSGSVIDLMFFRQAGRDQTRTAPYFYGYLFFVRLFQEWKARVPSLDLETFFYGATIWTGVIIPLTLLPALSVDNPAVERSSSLLPHLFADLLKDALSLTKANIEQLLGPSAPLVWIYDQRRFIVPEWYRADASLDNSLTAKLVRSVFGQSGDDEAAIKTAALIQTIESAKKLTRTAVREVYVAGIDDELHAVLVVEGDRIQNGAAGFEATTWFRFADQEVFEAFLSLAGDPREPLQRVRLGTGRVDITGKRFVRSGLFTYLHFWPDGVPRAGEPVPLPIALVRVLVCGEGKEMRAFIDAGDSEAKSLASLVRARDDANQLLEGIALALSPDYADVRYVLGELAALADAGSIAEQFLDAMVKSIPHDDIPLIGSSCRAIYCRILFPAADEVTVTAQRFDLLTQEIGEAGRRALRECIDRGLLLTRDRRCETRAEEPIFDSIRRAGLKAFGVPLIRRTGCVVAPDFGEVIGPE